MVRVRTNIRFPHFYEDDPRSGLSPKSNSPSCNACAPLSIEQAAGIPMGKCISVPSTSRVVRAGEMDIGIVQYVYPKLEVWLSGSGL